MTLCAVIFEMPSFWDRRRVDFRENCSRCFLNTWILAFVLTVTYLSLWPLLYFTTLPVFLSYSTIFVIFFLHGVFLTGKREILCLILSGLGQLILLRSNLPKFSTIRALKIGLQHPSWFQTTSAGFAIDKVLNNFAFICKKYYISKILTKVGLFNSEYKTHSKASHSVKEIIQANTNYCKKFKLNITELDKSLPIMYWLPKMHKTAICPRRFVALKNWSTKLLSDTLSKIFKMILVL